MQHPNTHYSNRLHVHEENYSTVEKEALSLILATQTFCIYLDSGPVVVYADHSALQFLDKMANHTQKLLHL